MLPIDMYWDSGISAFEAECIKEAVKSFQTNHPRDQITVYGNRKWFYGDFSSADWYIHHAKHIRHEGRNQIDAGSLLDLMSDNPGQIRRPHAEFCITSHELVDPEMNLCFGLTRNRYVLRSLFPYMPLCRKERKEAIMDNILKELSYLSRLR